MNITKENIVNLFLEHGYPLNLLGLNILAVRNNPDKYTNKFDDMIYWFYWDNDGMKMGSAKCTTKAGMYYARNPLNPLGTATIQPGFHRHSHRLGFHKGDYEALVQSGILNIRRDNDKDGFIDGKTIELSENDGINIHRASKSMESIQVDKWSAACIVFANPIVYNGFMTKVKHFSKIGQANFSLALIENESSN